MPVKSLAPRFGLAAALFALAAGCSGNNWVMNEQVDGTAKFDGKPLANAVIEFVPAADGKKQPWLSRGTTDEKGHFVLTCDNKKSGAVVGPHSVLVYVGRGEGDGKAPEPIPNVYTNLAKTPLKIDVTADKHTYDLELSAKAGGEKK
jgi:hypothetical protein